MVHVISTEMNVIYFVPRAEACYSTSIVALRVVEGNEKGTKCQCHWGHKTGTWSCRLGVGHRATSLRNPRKWNRMVHESGTSSKEGYGSKRGVFPVIMMIIFRHSDTHSDDIHINCRLRWDAVWSGTYLPTYRPGWCTGNVLCLYSESVRFDSHQGITLWPGGGNRVRFLTLAYHVMKETDAIRPPPGVLIFSSCNEVTAAIYSVCVVL
jgi:hypothetical protein